jgi:hypothetical protein
MLSDKPQSTAKESIQQVTHLNKTRILSVYCSRVKNKPHLLLVDQQHTMEELDVMQLFEHSRTSPKCSSMFLLNTGKDETTNNIKLAPTWYKWIKVQSSHSCVSFSSCISSTQN